MKDTTIEQLRTQVDQINLEILKLLSRRGEIVRDIGFLKEKKDMDIFSPVRESEMLGRILEHNEGPFSNEVVQKLFKEIFKASMSLIETEITHKHLYSRSSHMENTVVDVEGVRIGDGTPIMMAGPCSVESEEQMDKIAGFLARLGVQFLRGGAFKPRTSPYAFQGLRKKGLEILKDMKHKHGLKIITEVMDPRHLDLVEEYSDVLQIGARNMHNYELLKELGNMKKPVFLKRGFMSTIEEFLYSAEYILMNGNPNVILCERGIRTFEKWTRNTLDISAIPILKKESHLPVIVDISHALGRTDVMIPIAKACMTAGADGLMVEVHYQPSVALSDSDQQLNLPAFENFYKSIGFMKED